MPIYGNMIGGGAPLKTLILQDENGNEITGVVVGQEVVFDATDNDVREGKTYASDSGVSTGTKIIPAYHSREGTKLITNGSRFSFTNVDYDYTKLQAMICSFNVSTSKSVATNKVVINDCVYDVNSTTILSNVIKDDSTSCVDFGITNNSGASCVIRYLMYKEIE